MDPEFVKEWGPWAFFGYMILRDLLPKLTPSFVTALSKKISTEERLFALLENNATVLTTLNLSFTQLSETLKRIDDRLVKIEEMIEPKGPRLILKD